MKKILPVLVVLLLGGAWWFLQVKQSSDSSPEALPPSPQVAATPGSASAPITITDKQGEISRSSSNGIQAQDDTDEEPAETVNQVRPAADAYASAEEALAAVLKGAKDFDDSILEQFTEPGADCSWCPQFYTSVRELVTNSNTPQDQKSYLAEILAISGRVDNIQTLAESVKNAPSSSEADIYAEALELTVGKDDVTRYLGDQLSTTNDTLRESSVAAVTNQGTRLAAEILNKHIQERGDPDAYYSVGIGPGEFIPDEEALPFVQELVQKRDQFSPAWTKALINAGIPGLRGLFDQLDSSNNPEADRKLLENAIDHVNFEDGIKELTDQVIASNRNPAATEFARKIQEEFSEQEEQGVGTTEP